MVGTLKILDAPQIIATLVRSSVMEMLFVERPFDVETDKDFERKLFVFRNYISHQITSVTSNDPIGFYVASFSCKKLIYKGQLRSVQIRNYFKDLSDPRLRSAFGMVHSRFATNTFPSWRLAQPFRFIAHNGEINTLQGNLNWIKTNEKGFTSPYFSKQEMDNFEAKAKELNELKRGDTAVFYLYKK